MPGETKLVTRSGTAGGRWIRSLLLLLLAWAPTTAKAADPMPELVVTEVSPPLNVSQGKQFLLQFTARNTGSVNAARVPYLVVLSSVAGISVSDRPLLHSTVDLVAGAEPSVIGVQVMMPSDVPTGLFYVGVILDPDNEFIEANEQNNTGVSEPVLISSTDLRVLTTELPPAELGAHWCLRLDAAGGNGAYYWSLVSTSLPPGLKLEEVFPQTSGPALATRLCGRPASTGTFSFTLQVESAGKKAGHAYKLVVSESALPLRITTSELPVALFQSPFTMNLVAIGGTSPYAWSVASGRLPRGLHLRSDGAIVGAAEEDGRFSFTVRVKDGEGIVAEQPLDLVVASPARLTCVTRSLPARLVGETFSESLLAAGGSRPYRWTNVETRRLASGIGEESESLGEIAPPGLSVSSDGTVTGTGREIGRYLWTVEVSDANQASEACTVVVEVGVDHGLTISTRSLPAAVAGVSYLAKLEAAAGGTLEWSLFPGSKLPDDIKLSPGGLLEGAPSLEVLDGADKADFAFVVEVRDASNRVGIAALSLRVLAEMPETVNVDPTSTDTSPCQAAGGGPALVGGLLVLGLSLLRRRRS